VIVLGTWQENTAMSSIGSQTVVEFLCGVQRYEHELLADMAWTKRQYSKGQIDRAGNQLIAPPENRNDFESSLAIINNWRSCHSYPLQVIKMTLLNRAKRVSSSALIAQRLKRLPSIALKLRQNQYMKLSQMQDIGGCRAIMPNVRDAKKLMAIYKVSSSKNPRHGRPIQHEMYDYVAQPKPDGYRSFHLVFKYQSKYKDKKEFEGQRIEIQIRSRLQHIWATAVETVQTFTGQALKSKIKAGDPNWLRFFALMGSVIALTEKSPLVPETPQNQAELVDEIRTLSEALLVEDNLRAWGFAAEQLMAEAPKEAGVFLLVLDSSKKAVEITPFMPHELKEASDAYLQVEKESAERPEIQTVLVSVESVEALREAYPNYFLDTDAFIELMKRSISN
jgi:ppGpp synthetase/RelA/SpoT-type nucleotidyltranferase